MSLRFFDTVPSQLIIPTTASVQPTPSSSPSSNIRIACHSPSTPNTPPSKTSVHSCIFQPQQSRAPYPLLANTNFESLPSMVAPNHACIYCARQMSMIHNAIIRALNASHHHCSTFFVEEPKSPDLRTFIDPDPDVDLRHIMDFLEYNRLIFKMLHHHTVKEEFIFQQIEDLLVRMGRHKGSMQANAAQHQLFEAGLDVFEAYVFKTQPAEFQPQTLLHIIESFAPILVQHFHDGISTLLGLHVLKREDLMKIWKKAEYKVTKYDDWYTSLPFVLGCQDPEFELDGEARQFPSIPQVIRPILNMANKHWFSKRKAGVWTFLPCNIPREEVRPSSPASSKFHEEL